MRGTERPAKVRWTHPFLPPLKLLSDVAAQKIFMDIADDVHDIKEIEQLLLLTANLPLVIDLMANLVNAHGCAMVLSRWQSEKVGLISQGQDKSSSLSLSIRMSLSSPRMKSCPQTIELLGLLAILPEGLSDVELIGSQLPIRDVLTCKATLLCVSLVYINHKGRITVLPPIREYINQFHPTPASLAQHLFKYFYELLNLFEKYATAELGSIVTHIGSNLGNLHSILTMMLQPGNPDLQDAVYCTMYLDKFGQITGHGDTVLRRTILNVLPHCSDHRLEAFYIRHIFASWRVSPVSNAESLTEKAEEHFSHIEDLALQCMCTRTCG
jgi:hypothetical protein